jgi:carboxylesterase
LNYPVMAGAEPWSQAGSGATGAIGLLLVHGFTGNPVSMRPLGERLAARGFTVQVLRLPGHGTHFRDMQRTRYADWRAEVERALAELAARCARVVLVGLSMGATLVLDVAAEAGSAVAGVVTINAWILDRQGVVVKLAPLLEKILPLAPARAAGLVENDIAKPGGDEKAYRWVPAAAGNSVVRELPRVRQHVAKLGCPLLVAYSPQDHSVPPENSKALLRLAGSADKTELVLERSFHVATLDYDLPLLDERIAEFAARVAAPRPGAEVPT